MRPLDTLAHSVGARSKSNLEPIAAAAAPREVRPLLGALNGLFERLAVALEFERRFTADAAHELRTPLAAIKVQAQVCQAASDEAMRAHALAQVVCGVERATRLIEQLLRLARLDPLVGLTEAADFEPAVVLRDALDDVRAAADARQQTIDLELAATPARLHGDPDMLRLAVRNLLENAVRYSPQAGRIGVGITDTETNIRLWVRDSGAGVPDVELPHLSERFYRGRNTTQSGSGLGLAIVKRIAELHGAQLRLKNLPHGGFEAALEWPQPA
jgi:two-component system sensor histidine kinase QseC